MKGHLAILPSLKGVQIELIFSLVLTTCSVYPKAVLSKVHIQPDQVQNTVQREGLLQRESQKCLIQQNKNFAISRWVVYKSSFVDPLTSSFSTWPLFRNLEWVLTIDVEGNWMFHGQLTMEMASSNGRRTKQCGRQTTGTWNRFSGRRRAARSSISWFGANCSVCSTLAHSPIFTCSLTQEIQQVLEDILYQYLLPVSLENH